MAIIRFHEGDPIVDRAEKIIWKDAKSDKESKIKLFRESELRRNQHMKSLSEFYKAPNMFKLVRSSPKSNLVDMASVQSENALMLLGHGNSSKVGGLTPEQMSKFLYDQGLSGPIVIFLMACGVSEVDSYALRLKMDLIQRHKIISAVAGAKAPVTVSATELKGTVYTTCGVSASF